MGSWVIAIVGALSVGLMIYQQAHSSLSSDQQTITSSTTSVVVVLIPGFTIESIILGVLVGIAAIAMLRRRSTHQAKNTQLSN
jgi:hypothetical protein